MSFWNWLYKISPDVCVAATPVEIFQLIISGISICYDIRAVKIILKEISCCITIACRMILINDDGSHSIITRPEQPYIWLGLWPPVFFFKNLYRCLILWKVLYYVKLSHICPIFQYQCTAKLYIILWRYPLWKENSTMSHNSKIILRYANVRSLSN